MVGPLLTGVAALGLAVGVDLLRVEVYAVAHLIVTGAVIVLLLGTGHDVDVVCAEGVDVLQIGVAHDVVLPSLQDAVPSVVVAAVRVRRDFVGLGGGSVLGTQVGMDVQILETMYLIVHLDVAREVVDIGIHLLLTEQRHGVLRSVVVLYILPARVYRRRTGSEPLEVAAHKLIVLAVVAYRTGGVHREGCTDGTACVGIAVFLVHVLGVDIEYQVVLEETGRQIDRTVETTHPAGHHDTIVDIIAQAHAVGHVLQTTLHAEALVSRYGSAEDLVLPVGVGIAELAGIQSVDRTDQTLVLGGVEHVVFLLDGRHGEVGIVREHRCLSGASFLSGDDDYTIGTA